MYHFKRLSDIRNPPPSRAWVLIDVHEDSINDGTFNVPWGEGPFLGWGNIPSSRHGGVGVLSFADGHVELKKWLDPETRVPVIRFPHFPVFTPRGKDVIWLRERTTAWVK